jgi:hypothetical protein
VGETWAFDVVQNSWVAAHRSSAGPGSSPAITSEDGSITVTQTGATTDLSAPQVEAINAVFTWSAVGPSPGFQMPVFSWPLSLAPLAGLMTGAYEPLSYVPLLLSAVAGTLPSGVTADDAVMVGFYLNGHRFAELEISANNAYLQIQPMLISVSSKAVTGGAISLNAPPSLHPGNMLVAVIYAASGGNTIGAPEGEDWQTYSVWSDDSAPSAQDAAVFYRTVTTGDPPFYGFGTSGNGPACGALLEFWGVPNVTVPPIDTSLWENVDTATKIFPLPRVLATWPDEILVSVVFSHDGIVIAAPPAMGEATSAYLSGAPGVGVYTMGRSSAGLTPVENAGLASATVGMTLSFLTARWATYGTLADGLQAEIDAYLGTTAHDLTGQIVLDGSSSGLIGYSSSGPYLIKNTSTSAHIEIDALLGTADPDCDLTVVIYYNTFQGTSEVLATVTIPAGQSRIHEYLPVQNFGAKGDTLEASITAYGGTAARNLVVTVRSVS